MLLGIRRGRPIRVMRLWSFVRRDRIGQPALRRVMPTAAQDFQLARDQNLRVRIVLRRRDSVVVEGEADKLDPSATTTAEASREQIRSLPERVADVRNAVPLLPGVVRTPEGKLQISGTPEYRSTFLVNSVDVTDPATGSFGATVPIDVIETVRVYKSPFLAEYGRFSSAVVAVVTRRGGDKWQYELNDPTPEMRIRSGHLRGVRGFTPRLALTGPVIKRKLYFAGAGTYELRKRPIYPLPFPYNEEKSQRINAYAQLDWILRPTHFVTMSGHFVPDRANFRNLGFYTPQPTAPSWKSHEYRGTVSDHLDGELGTFDTSVSAAEIRGNTGSQGPEDLILAPNTSGGNYFFNQDRRSRRLQFNEIWSLPLKTAAGKHSIRMGGKSRALDAGWRCFCPNRNSCFTNWRAALLDSFSERRTISHFGLEWRCVPSGWVGTDSPFCDSIQAFAWMWIRFPGQLRRLRGLGWRGPRARKAER